MKKKTWLILLLVVAYIGFILYKHNERSMLMEQAEKEQLEVVTSFYPMYVHTSAIMQGTPHKVINMADQTVGCLHDYQLTVQDTKKLYEADILVINGLGSETFIEKAYKQNPNLQVIDSSRLVEEYLHEDEENIDEAENHIHEDEDHDHEDHDHEDENAIHEEDVLHDEEIGHTHETGEAEDGHHHENDHIWLSLEGTIAQVQEITNRLCELDPAYNEIYRNNANNYIAEIQALSQGANHEMEMLKDKKAVTVHDAFYYLAKDLEIEVVENIPEGSYENASARQIEKLINHMKEEEVEVIFTEARNQDLAILKTIQSELLCRVYVLDALVTEPDEIVQQGTFEYVERMRRNIETIREAFKNE